MWTETHFQFFLISPLNVKWFIPSLTHFKRLTWFRHNLQLSETFYFVSVLLFLSCDHQMLQLELVFLCYELCMLSLARPGKTDASTYLQLWLSEWKMERVFISYKLWCKNSSILTEIFLLLSPWKRTSLFNIFKTAIFAKLEPNLPFTSSPLNSNCVLSFTRVALGYLALPAGPLIKHLRSHGRCWTAFMMLINSNKWMAEQFNSETSEDAFHQGALYW